MGLSLLSIISEEFTSTREDLPVIRKEELKLLLSKQCNVIIKFFIEYLQYLKNVPDRRSCAPQISKALETFSSYASWLELSEDIDWIRAITTIQSFYDSNISSISIACLNCIVELMSKQFIPKNAEHVILGAFNVMLQVTQRAVDVDLDEEYLEKVIFLISQFMTRHVQRAEKIPNFPMTNFLNNLLKITFKQTDYQLYEDCLDVWISLTDHLVGQQDVSRKQSDGNSLYHHVLLTLCQEVIKRCYLSMNSIYLDQIDDERPDAQGRTDQDLYLEKCIDLIESISSCTSPLLIIRGILSTPISKPIDAKFYMRCIARLSFTFCDHFESTQNDVLMLISRVLQWLNEPVLVVDVFELIRIIIPWLTMYNSKSVNSKQVIESILDGCYKFPYGVSNMRRVDPILHASCKCIRHISTDVKPKYLMELEAFKKILSCFKNYLDPQFANSKFGTNVPITGTIVLQDLAVAASEAIFCASHDESWQTKTFSFLMGSSSNVENDGLLIVHRYKSAMEQKDVNNICLLLDVCGSIIINLQSIQSKQIVYDSFRDVISSIPIVLKFNNSMIYSTTLQFVHCVFRNLKSQCGQSFVEQVVTIVIDGFQNDNSSNAIVNLLDIFTVVIEDGKNRFVGIHEKIISILKRMDPNVAPDSFFKLLFDLLKFGWSIYFFDINLQMVTATPKSINAQNDFVFIMSCFLNAFKSTSTDLNVFDENVKHLVELNNTTRLFCRPFFRGEMCGAFCNVFLDVLVKKSHPLLKDKIIDIIFRMNVGDCWNLFFSFLQAFLASKNLSEEEIKVLIGRSFVGNLYQKDVQQFTKCLTNFIADLCFLLK
ncbi:exportin-6 [Acrasis kona]|uniref:Exportin-6 n=1 Tax=Acrasis kona TaxID=1008807 RepID=A0AAW2YTU0_9EUKA